MSPGRVTDRQFALLLTAGALVLRLAWLGRDDFWSDEVHTAEAVALPVADLIRERLAAGHKPLYFLLLKLWSEVAGHGHFALRLPGAIAGALAVFPALALFRRLLDPAAARWAAALLVFHPIWMELSREARMYPIAALAFLLAAAGIARAADEGRTPWWFWAGVLLGPLLHPSWGLGLTGLAVWTACEWVRSRRKGPEALPVAVPVGIALSAALLLGGIAAASRVTVSMTRRPWIEEIVVYGLRQFGGAGLTREHALFHGAVAAVWCVALVLGWRRASVRTRTFAVALIVGTHASAALVGAGGLTAWGPVRYVSLAVIGYAVLAGAALPSRRVLSAALLLAVAASLAVRFVPEQTASSSEAARVLASGEDPAAALAACPSDGARVVLRYYLAHPRRK